MSVRGGLAAHAVRVDPRRLYDIKKFTETDHWQTDYELDRVAGAINVLAGASLACIQTHAKL